MAEGLRHVVHRRVHLERSQPRHRRDQVGQYLEKKRDYKKRAERYHLVERKIKDLAAKSRFRNEDEFNFKMIHGKLGDDGIVVLPSSSSVASRKLPPKKQFRRSLEQLDRSRFVLQHRTNLKEKRAKKAITENATILMGDNSHIEFADSDDSVSEVEPVHESDTDSNDEMPISGDSSSMKKQPADSHAVIQGNLQVLTECIDAKHEDDTLRQRLDAERNLRVAVHKKRQIRKVKGTGVHMFPFVRQK
ncbi:U3 small nnucleolar RNA-associated protein 11 (Utp11) family protein [Babesia bovis T2Bo]|uniref:U3 small nucleolar RNA-associated protein 11 n=1 Tax=Babesia bovis TaxID=5865 RepID=A7AWU5_BABBO|nr:U3 small nnucleolar RNA-associated protein 11 (Utp11) family protein [Babesia bovis T2Bo]EDO05523.1 U3 small nnucleolar RNA-associated protein 11 (Utp11) family protein [Babesia bovis T2Bo]|eukprot:XP_001609091.1 hypothetical protein [Babesia bovis T2Bo]